MANSGAPEVSIALLTLNAGPLLERLIAGIDVQDTDRVVECVALDSGSTDGTVERLESAGFRVEPYWTESFDFGRARDRLYELTRGEFVVNLSQDAIPARSDWLETLLAGFADDVAIVSGRSVPDEERLYGQFHWEKNGLFYFTSEMRRYVQRYGRGVSFANSVIRRSVWEEYRFLPIPVGEDFQLQARLHWEPWRVAFADDATVLHHHDYTVATLRERCAKEGMALKAVGIPYRLIDALVDSARPRVWTAWARAALSGKLNSAAEWLFPVVRPWSVYRGSRTVHLSPGESVDRDPEKVRD